MPIATCAASTPSTSATCRLTCIRVTESWYAPRRTSTWSPLTPPPLPACRRCPSGRADIAGQPRSAPQQAVGQRGAGGVPDPQQPAQGGRQRHRRHRGRRARRPPPARPGCRGRPPPPRAGSADRAVVRARRAADDRQQLVPGRGVVVQPRAASRPARRRRPGSARARGRARSAGSPVGSTGGGTSRRRSARSTHRGGPPDDGRTAGGRTTGGAHQRTTRTVSRPSPTWCAPTRAGSPGETPANGRSVPSRPSRSAQGSPSASAVSTPTSRGSAGSVTTYTQEGCTPTTRPGRGGPVSRSRAGRGAAAGRDGMPGP